MIGGKKRSLKLMDLVRGLAPLAVILSSSQDFRPGVIAKVITICDSLHSVIASEPFATKQTPTHGTEQSTTTKPNQQTSKELPSK